MRSLPSPLVRRTAAGARVGRARQAMRARGGARGMRVGSDARSGATNTAGGGAADVEVGGGAGGAARRSPRGRSSGGTSHGRAGGRERAAWLERPRTGSEAANARGDGGEDERAEVRAARGGEGDEVRSGETCPPRQEEARKGNADLEGGHDVTPQVRLHGAGTTRVRWVLGEFLFYAHPPRVLQFQSGNLQRNTAL